MNANHSLIALVVTMLLLRGVPRQDVELLSPLVGAAAPTLPRLFQRVRSRLRNGLQRRWRWLAAGAGAFLWVLAASAALDWLADHGLQPHGAGLFGAVCTAVLPLWAQWLNARAIVSKKPPSTPLRTKSRPKPRHPSKKPPGNRPR
jgi:hypothetical protein